MLKFLSDKSIIIKNSVKCQGFYEIKNSFHFAKITLGI